MKRLALLVLAMLATPSAAHAAEVSVSNGLLRYEARAGFVSHAIFVESGGTVEVTTGTGDTDGLTAGPGCVDGTPVVCTTPAGTVAHIDAGDLSDRITIEGLTTIRATVLLGEGNDAASGGGGDDVINGGPGNDDLHGGPGNDTLTGMEGNDILRGDVGADDLNGGDGIDTAVFGFRTTPVYTLDGLRNDGGAGENDLIGTDVENIEAAADGDGIVTMVGDGRANRLTVTGGRGDLTGGEGADVLEGGALDDVLRARDGSPDTILCGAGIDRVEADTLDIVSTTCEDVAIQPMPGGPFDDRPPLMTWTAPEPEATLPANRPTTLAVDATDDRGALRVQFYDDDRLLCEDAAPPFTCEYQPRGSDVGRNTLLAVGIDGANQTTTLVRTVRVRRFSPPRLELTIRPTRDRRPPYAFRATGRLERPSAVAPSQGCSGEVKITAKAGRRTVTTRRVKLSPTCEYGLTLRFRRKRPARRLRVTARFAGNEVLGARTSRARTIRLG